MARLVGLLLECLLVCSLCCELADASTPPLVVIVAHGDTEPLGARVAAELSARSWRTRLITPERGRREDDPSRLAADYSANAVAELVGDHSAVELWIADQRGGGKVHEVVRAPDGSAEVLAIRTAEALRARFVELGIVAPPAPAPAPEPEPARDEPPPPAAPPPSSPSSRLHLELAPAVTFSPGGLGPLFHGWAGVLVEPSSRWSAGLLAALPLVPGDVTAAEGRADVRVWLAAAAARYAAWQTKTWRATLGAAAGTVVLTMRGSDAEHPFRARTDRVVAGVFFGETSLGWRVVPRVTLEARLAGGVAAPRPVVRFAERVVASWGRPFGSAGIGLSLALPVP